MHLLHHKQSSKIPVSLDNVVNIYIPFEGESVTYRDLNS